MRNQFFFTCIGCVMQKLQDRRSFLSNNVSWTVQTQRQYKKTNHFLCFVLSSYFFFLHLSSSPPSLHFPATVLFLLDTSYVFFLFSFSSSLSFFVFSYLAIMLLWLVFYIMFSRSPSRLTWMLVMLLSLLTHPKFCTKFVLVHLTSTPLLASGYSAVPPGRTWTAHLKCCLASSFHPLSKSLFITILSCCGLAGVRCVENITRHNGCKITQEFNAALE